MLSFFLVTLKRGRLGDMPLDRKSEKAPEIYGSPPSPFSSQGKEMEILVKDSGEEVIKNRRKTWRNFNAKTVKMGIVRESMNPQILEDKEGNFHMEDLIDPTLVFISYNERKFGLNLLNNAKNSMIDNFHSIKWLFHELDQIKDRMGQL